MKKKHFEFSMPLPEAVNADHQAVPVIHSDITGSYTGVPLDPYDKPVQDADDL
jgi:hypothetical protein